MAFYRWANFQIAIGLASHITAYFSLRGHSAVAQVSYSGMDEEYQNDQIRRP